MHDEPLKDAEKVKVVEKQQPTVFEQSMNENPYQGEETRQEVSVTQTEEDVNVNDVSQGDK